MAIRVKFDVVSAGGGKLNTPTFYRIREERLTKAVARETDIIVGAFLRMTRKFDKTRVVYYPKTLFEKQDLVGQVEIDSKIFFYLDEGTDFRYATMTKDYKAGTRTGTIGYSGRQGQLAYVNTSIPRPGIKARKFRETLIKRRDIPFAKKISRIIYSFADGKTMTVRIR